jgi:dTDP-4-amino-4,6-dideoxygalactose transaminase
MAIASRDLDKRPAVNGGAPAFPDGLPLTRPFTPDSAQTAADVVKIMDSKQMTNSSFVRAFEQRAAEYLDVPHCVAVSSCTAGLMLVLKTSARSGDVVIPSFTFSATAHAVAWNGMRPVFADVDPQTLTMSPAALERAIGVRTSAILATHLYGTPCDVELLEDIAASNGVRLFFDAAHAFGSKRGGKPIGGFGDAEVFSLSPTKVLATGEGGLVATHDGVLAERLRIGRDYGNPGDYDCRFVGLNARMSEFHAAVALRSLETLDERIEYRNMLVDRYRRALSRIPGIRFPYLREDDTSTYKDFTIMVDSVAFGVTARRLGQALADEGIDTRRYYSPPVHEMKAYKHLAVSGRDLPVTVDVADRVLTLPLSYDMTEETVLRVADAIERIHRFYESRSRSPRVMSSTQARTG